VVSGSSDSYSGHRDFNQCWKMGLYKSRNVW
jgi:hypothetical protein